jgi:hypothetical protein
VQIFQKIWSGRVVNEGTAWELVTLLDQIHLWAVTEFRTFVLEHLRPWHTFCDDNYLLDWDSVYDTSPERKRKRTYSEDSDLPLPSWTNLLDKPSRLRVQVRAKKSLARAIRERQLRKGKAKCSEKDSGSEEFHWHCMKDNCYSIEPEFESGEAFLNHMRCFHGQTKSQLSSMRRVVEQVDSERYNDSLTVPFADHTPRPSKKRVRAC